MRKRISLIAGCIFLSSSALFAQDKTQQAPAQPASRAPAPPNDLEFVEKVINARKEYQHSLELLREHYVKAGDVERARWVEDELLTYHRISKRAYRLDLDVPPPTLQAAYNIAEANELYRKGMTYKGRGWFTEHDDNLRRAELIFQQILSNYPQSDKIDDAAYQLAEIYESRPYKQYRRAAYYYERTFQWNPNTQYDARIRAARLYDKVLKERTHAIQLYREVISHDVDQKRIDEAKKRLGDLSSAPP